MFEMNILRSSYSWIAPEVEDVPHVAAHALAQAAVQQVFGSLGILKFWVNRADMGLPRGPMMSPWCPHDPGSDAIKIFFHRYHAIKKWCTLSSNGYECGDRDAMILINPYILILYTVYVFTPHWKL